MNCHATGDPYNEKVVLGLDDGRSEHLYCILAERWSACIKATSMSIKSYLKTEILASSQRRGKPALLMLHTHPIPSVIYFLTDCTQQLTAADGTKRDITSKAGTSNAVPIIAQSWMKEQCRRGGLPSCVCRAQIAKIASEACSAGSSRHRTWPTA